MPASLGRMPVIFGSLFRSRQSNCKDATAAARWQFDSVIIDIAIGILFNGVTFIEKSANCRRRAGYRGIRCERSGFCSS
jgi:hypothetical protein